MYDLSGKRALVCGSTQGIGRASALRLAQLGADVTLAARNPESLAATAAEISSAVNRHVETICADSTDSDAVRDRVTEHVAEHGPFTILVNNTGGPPHGAIVDATPVDFVRALSMHVGCNHLLVQTLLPGMKSAGYGRIVNIVSTSVREPIPGLGVSNTTRAAVAGWAKTLSKELGPFGITVNNVLPGFTETGRIRDLIRARAESTGQTPEAVEAAMTAGVPLGRFAEPREIAEAVAFLASPAASYITGVSLAVDGGRMASI